MSFSRPHPEQPPTISQSIMDINGPSMGWNNNDGLCQYSTIWKQKCKLTLGCQLEYTSYSCKSKSVLQWSGDCALEIYKRWNIAGKTRILLMNNGADGMIIVTHKPMKQEQAMTFDIL